MQKSEVTIHNENRLVTIFSQPFSSPNERSKLIAAHHKTLRDFLVRNGTARTKSELKLSDRSIQRLLQGTYEQPLTYNRGRAKQNVLYHGKGAWAKTLIWIKENMVTVKMRIDIHGVAETSRHYGFSRKIGYGIRDGIYDYLLEKETEPSAEEPRLVIDQKPQKAGSNVSPQDIANQLIDRLIQAETENKGLWAELTRSTEIIGELRSKINEQFADRAWDTAFDDKLAKVT